MKLKYSILIIIALLPILCIGQHNNMLTRTDSIIYTSPYRDLRVIPCERHFNYTHNPKGEPIYHGTMTIKGKDNNHGGYRNDNQQYEEIRNYNDGLLEGKFSQSYSHNGNGSYGGNYTIHHQWNVHGNFSNGRPDGVWEFNLDSRLTGSGDRSNTQRTETAIYEKGKLKSLTDRKGEQLTFDEDGLISGKGHLKEGTTVHLQHSIICNSYCNQVGDILPMGREQKQIINEIVENHGKYNIFKLADRGYTIDWQEAFLSQYTRYAEHIDRYVQIERIAPNFPMPTYSVRLGYLKQIQKVNDDDAIEYYIQRQNHFAEMMRDGYFIRWHAKRYFGTTAAEKIKTLWLENQRDMLARKLNLIINTTANYPWRNTIIECRKGENPLPDLFACQWSSNSLSKEDAYIEMADLIDQKLSSLYPIVGFEIDTTTCTPEANMITQCILHRGTKDSVGYESIRLQLITNSEGYILLNRMQPEQYQRIENLWDTIYRLEDTLRSEQLEIRSLLYSTDNKSFKHYCDSVMGDKTIRPEVRWEDLKALQQLQKETALNAPLLKKISTAHTLIMAKMERFKYILKLYHTYYETIEPSWDSHLEDLKTLKEVQQKIIKTEKSNDFPTIERNLKRTRETNINRLIELL